MAVWFTSDEWKTLPTQELVRRCRDLSAEAQALAIDARPEDKQRHLRLAGEWSKLASEIEKYAQEERDGRRNG